MLKRYNFGNVIIILCLFVIAIQVFTSCSSKRRKCSTCPAWGYDAVEKNNINSEELSDNDFELSSNIK